MKTLMKDTIREIRNSFGRFISIFLIIALGVGFFAGIKATAPDMKNTADRHFRDYNLMDFFLISSYGFNQDDVDSFKNLEGIDKVSPAYSMDAIFKVADENRVINLMSLGEDPENSLNKPILKSGRLPEKKGEIVLEDMGYLKEKYRIGDKIRLESGREEDLLDDLENNEFEIVGFARSPLHIVPDRGSSQIGNGKVACFGIVKEEEFKSEFYSAVYLGIDQELNSFSSEYKELLALRKEEIEELGEERRQARYKDIKDELKEKLRDGQEKLEEESSKGEKELLEAREKLDQAKTDFKSGERLYDEGLESLRESERQAEARIKSGELDLVKGRGEYEKSKNQLELEEINFKARKEEAELELEKAQEEVEKSEAKLLESEKALKLALAESSKAQEEVEGLKLKLEDLRLELEQIPENTEEASKLKAEVEILEKTYEAARLELEPELEKIQAGKRELEVGRQELEKAKTEISKNKKALEEGEESLKKGKEALNLAQGEILEAESSLDQAKTSLKTEGDKARRRLEEEKLKLDHGKLDIMEAEKEYEDGLQDFKREIEKAERDLKKLEREIKKLEKPSWYIIPRDGTRDYIEYEMGADRIDSVAKVFPLFFFLIALLVCLTTMTRMVDEQRGYIGTLKALGYSNPLILSKYLIYGLIASIFGSLFGLVVGFKVFPTVIFNAYRIMFIMPEIETEFNLYYGLISMLAAILTTSLASLIAVRKELKETTANLMRPKAPKVGKRIFLEKIDFLWKRFSFSQKVTARNIFRYKRRLFMTVIGIAGCTALLVAGFGLMDSIKGITENQFDYIYDYHMNIDINNGIIDRKEDPIIKALNSDTRIDSFILTYTGSIDLMAGDRDEEIEMVVSESGKNIKDFIKLQNRLSSEELFLDDDSVILTEKIASMLDIKKGDLIRLEKDKLSYEVKVKGITENYANHFVYMTDQLYEKIFDEEVEFNNILVKNKETGKEFEDQLSSDLLEIDDVSAILFITGLSQSLNDTMGSLNYVIAVLIVTAGGLAFIVLYNLTTINIGERLREIATIKVLGFYDNEVSSYVYRENNILTVIGILVGFILGIMLHQFVVLTVEIDMIMFGRVIRPVSFLYSALLTLGFALFVNFVMHFKLKDIDMVESLKSID